jgi:hypothetical protein
MPLDRQRPRAAPKALPQGRRSIHSEGRARRSAPRVTVRSLLMLSLVIDLRVNFQTVGGQKCLGVSRSRNRSKIKAPMRDERVFRVLTLLVAVTEQAMLELSAMDPAPSDLIAAIGAVHDRAIDFAERVARLPA